MQKTYINATLSGLVFMGFLGSVVVRVFEWAGLLETALFLRSLTDHGSGLGLNGTALSFTIFCICASGLIFINFRNAKNAYAKWRDDRRPQFMSAYYAAMWLCHWTLLGEAWPAESKHDDGLKAMETLGRQGKLTFKGCTADGHDLEEVSPSTFANAHLMEYEANEARGRALALVSNASIGKPLFTGLVVDQKQVRKLWPKSGRGGTFVGWVN